MRNTFLFGLIILVLSCNNDTQEPEALEFNTRVLPQKWELFMMTGNFPGSVTEGEEMEWQESYVLRGDRSFTKTRTTSDFTISGEGTFEFFTENEETGIVFTFDRDSEIIGNCTGDQIEYLYLNTTEQTLQASWWACDGAGLFYKRVE